MRIRLFLTGTVFALLLGGCAVAPPQPEGDTADAPRAAAQPRIVFAENAKYDFGIIKQSRGIVRHDFPFTYRGNVPLTITGTPTSCACTGANADRRALQPGDGGVLTVTLNPNLHAEPPGRFFKTALILTDPPLPETPEVTIFAEIDLDLGPEAFELKDDHGGEESGGEHDDEQEAAMNLSGAAQAGHIGIEATVIDAANIETLKQTYGAALESALPPPDKTTVLLVLDNHREDLSQYNYRSLTSLDGTGAEEWQQLSSAMGGHHVAGVLTFPKTRETPKEVRITGLSAGEAVIFLAERTPRG